LSSRNASSCSRSEPIRVLSLRRGCSVTAKP
jgi:hypothetical protein